MAHTDVFAFQQSALAAFLYADVGTDIGGSQLTVLSVLARLGQDPWEAAGQWVRLPMDTAIDRLTQGIVQMPLSEQALLDARETATRLVKLLPRRVTDSARDSPIRSWRRSFTTWTPVYIAMLLLAAAIVVSQFVGLASNGQNAVGTEQTTRTPTQLDSGE